MPPDRLPRSKDTLRHLMPDRFQPVEVVRFDVTLDEVMVLGDVAHARGFFVCHYLETLGRDRTDGQLLSVLKRQADGAWKFYIDGFNATGV